MIEPTFGLVARVQAELNVLGYRDARGLELVVDGRHGPATRSALARFQRDHGLVADGALSETTLGWLAEDMGLRGSDMPYHPPHESTGARMPAPPARPLEAPAADYKWMWSRDAGWTQARRLGGWPNVGSVSDVQLALGLVGYLCPRGLPLVVDGQLDTFTRRTIEEFQGDHGLALDGVPTPATRHALEVELDALGWDDVDFHSPRARCATATTRTGLGTIIPSTYQPPAAPPPPPADETTGLGLVPFMLAEAALGAGAYWLGRQAGARQTGASSASAPVHKTGYRRAPSSFRCPSCGLECAEPYCHSCCWAFPWPGHAIGNVMVVFKSVLKSYELCVYFQK